MLEHDDFSFFTITSPTDGPTDGPTDRLKLIEHDETSLQMIFSNMNLQIVYGQINEYSLKILYESSLTDVLLVVDATNGMYYVQKGEVSVDCHRLFYGY